MNAFMHLNGHSSNPLHARGRGCCTVKCFWAGEAVISQELASSLSPPIQLISPLTCYDNEILMEVPRRRLPRVNMAKEFVKGLRDCNSEDGLLGLMRDYKRYLDGQAITALGSFLADAVSGKKGFLSPLSSLISYARSEWVPLFMDSIHQMDHVGLSIGIQSLVKITSLTPGYSILNGDDVMLLSRAVDEIMHLCSPRSAVEILSGLWRLGSDVGLSANGIPLPLPWITRFLSFALPSSSLLKASPHDLGVLLRCLAKMRQHQARVYKSQMLHQKEQSYFAICETPRYPFSRRWATNLMMVLERKATYMNLREVGTTAWSLSVLNIDPGPNVLNEMWKRAEMLLFSSLQSDPSLSSASLGGLFYSLCRSSHPPPSSLLGAIQVAASRSHDADPLKRNMMELMSARDLMLLLMALGRWAPTIDGPLQLAISRALERGSLLSGCSPSSIAGILYSAAQLGIRPKKEVMHLAEKRLLSLSQGIGPSVSSRLLMAFCILGYVPCSPLGSFLVAELVDHMDYIAAKRFFPSALAVVKLRLPVTEAQLRALVVGPEDKYQHIRGMKNFVQHAQVISAASRVIISGASLRDGVIASGLTEEMRTSAERLIMAASDPQDGSGLRLQDLNQIKNDLFSTLFLRDQ